jgi:type I restriction enzyme, R subunit
MRDVLPKASFIGFMDTPIEQTDKNAPAYIGIYDIQQAVESGTTVRLYYELRPPAA